MNRYPLWKNMLVLVVLVLGFIYTLPNFYGEAPAVQVSCRIDAQRPEGGSGAADSGWRMR